MLFALAVAATGGVVSGVAARLPPIGVPAARSPMECVPAAPEPAAKRRRKGQLMSKVKELDEEYKGLDKAKKLIDDAIEGGKKLLEGGD